MSSPSSRRSSRSRKSVQAFNYDEREKKKEERGSFEVEKGKGDTVGDFPDIGVVLRKYTAASAEIQKIYRLMFLRTGKATERKAHIKKFSGITWSTNKDEILQKCQDMSSKWNTDLIKRIMDMLGIDRSSTTGGVSKSELVDRLAEWMIEPTRPIKLKFAEKRKRSKSTKRKKASKGTVKKKKSKASKTKGDDETDEAPEENEDEETPEESKENQNLSAEEQDVVKAVQDYISSQENPGMVSLKVLKNHIEDKFGKGKAKEHRKLMKETVMQSL